MIPRVELAPGYTIPRIILGAWQLASGHSPQGAAQADVFATWDRAMDLGLDTFDCADIYTGVESLIGEFVARRRRAAAAIPQVHTKFVPDLAVLPIIDRAYVNRIVDRSLQRTGLDRLDLVQFHWWDYAIPRYLDTLGWLADLRREGKIGALGLTNFDGPRTRELAALGEPISLTQVQYSVLDQRPARLLDRIAGGNRIGLLCYGTLAGGFLSDRWLGKPEPDSAANRSLVKYRLIIEEIGGWDRFQAILRALEAIAQRNGVPLSAVALRWVLDRRAVTAAIVGTKVGGRFDTLESAARLRLDDADVAAIAAATGPDPGPPGDVYGAERAPGKHAEIMKYDLNSRAPD